jgi:acetyl esterase/lipase
MRECSAAARGGAPSSNICIMRYKIILASAACSMLAWAQEPQVIPIWPAGSLAADAATQHEVVTENAAHEHTVTNIHNPTITAYLPPPEKATGVAIVVAPGGGHRFLSIDHEGYDVGKWLASIGVAGFVLKYRLARAENSHYTVEDADQDAQRAIRVIRSRAEEWHVNPAKVGILGFSAGGEVAVLAATKFDRGKPEAADAIEHQSSRPDFQVLIYPGVQPANIVVTKDTPPAFMLCANDDAGPSIAIPALAQALKKAGVPVEIHIYNRGGHGFGIRPRPLPISSWPVRLQEWMEDSGILPRKD